MITADEARKGTKTESNEELIKFTKEVEARIRRAMEEGMRSCYFGSDDPYMRDYERQAKEEFTKRGFSFRPRGYIGGVYQRTQQICW